MKVAEKDAHDLCEGNRGQSQVNPLDPQTGVPQSNADYRAKNAGDDER